MSSFARTAAIVGLGQLGKLMARKIDAEKLLLVSSDRSKAEAMAAGIPRAEYASPERLSEAGLVIICLPAHDVTAYVEMTMPLFHPQAVIVNPATMLYTDKLRERFGGLRLVPLKFLGSVKALETGVSALMITDSEEAKQYMLSFVAPLGELIVGQEQWVADCNTIASRHALEAALRIEDDIRAAGYPESLIYPAQTVVAKGIIQSFADDTLGHFAKDVLARVRNERAKSV